ncbi:MAG TPA: DNA recombination protein RmuC [Acetobacteraceae bacterium]|nr:DNA recombination protein RmuC [Acetobacteraceae bacterium]
MGWLAIGIAACLILLILLLALQLTRRDDGAAAEAEALRRALAETAEGLRRQIAESSRETLNTAFDRVQEGARAQAQSVERMQSAIIDLTTLIGQRLAEADQAAAEGRASLLRETMEAVGRLTESQTRLSDRVSRDLGAVGAALREEQERLRGRVEAKLDEMRAGNEAKLEAMRAAVDEQLQSALEKRVGESFQRVAEQFAEVQRAIGQVQSVASQVGDLKRLFSNVKSRGGWGEAQIRQILEDTLPPGAFEVNLRVGRGSEVVEFALRMPVRDADRPVFMAIDAKFPTEDYDRLLACVEAADREGEVQAIAALGRRIKDEARKIASKYICPPDTTDIAVLYLPTEGLFAEAARIPGLIEQVQREYRVLVQSPSLLPALLHTIRVGHFTVQLERKAGEIGKILGAVKAEWGKLGDSLDSLARKADALSKGVEDTQRRTRAVGRKLRSIEAVEYAEAAPLLGFDALMEEE